VRWFFAEDSSAIQACHVTRIFYDYDVTKAVFAIKVSVLGAASPFTITRYTSRSEAEEAIKDMVVGREHRRS
jgi:hypothetical protein